MQVIPHPAHDCRLVALPMLLCGMWLADEQHRYCCLSANLLLPSGNKAKPAFLDNSE